MIRIILFILFLVPMITSSLANNWQVALEHHSGISSYNIDRRSLNDMNVDYRDVHPFVYASYTAFTAKYDFRDFALYMGLSHFTTGNGTNFGRVTPGGPGSERRTAKYINHHIGMPIGIAYKLLYRSHKVYPFFYAGLEPALNFEPVFKHFPADVEADYKASGDLNPLFSLYTNVGIGVGYKLSEKIDLEFSFNYLQDITNFANTTPQQAFFITGTNLIRDYQLSWGVSLNYNLKPRKMAAGVLNEL